MTTLRSTRTRAFTIIELMMVIAIIVLVAGLIVWAAGRASETKKVTRAQVENARLVTLIEAYKHKLGVYPPQNLIDPTKNTLVYELAGAIVDESNPSDLMYITPFGKISSSTLLSEFGVSGIVNSFRTNGQDDITEFKRFLRSMKPDQFVASGPNNVLRLVVPVDDSNGNRPNYWSYLAGTNEVGKLVRNPDSFDLWVDITARGQTRRMGNWKD